jgi:hypothetical protein
MHGLIAIELKHNVFLIIIRLGSEQGSGLSFNLTVSPLGPANLGLVGGLVATLPRVGSPSR